jgi:hypothetical protein
VILFLGTEPPFKSGLPRPEEFSKALYTIDIGQNDLAYGFLHTSEEQVQRSIPDILSQFSQAVKVSKNQILVYIIIYKIYYKTVRYVSRNNNLSN